MPVIKTEVIPKSIPKKQRARLIKLQREKVMRQMKQVRFVWEPQTMERVTPYDNNLTKGSITKAFADLLTKTELKWRVNCYILSRESNGKNKLTPYEVLITTPCTHNDISALVADALHSEVQEFITKPYGKTFITAAWIASEINVETSEDQAYQLFESIGAWELPSDSEEAVSQSTNQKIN